jgi:cell division protein ZapD
MAEITQAMPMAENAERPVFYEQPLLERIRTFMRLEFLFSQAHYHASRESRWSSRAAITNLIDIFAILSRGDVRSEVLKELERHAALLSQYQFRQDVDAGRLNALLETINSLRDSLGSTDGQLVQALKDSQFLSAIKHRSSIPGGTCEFDLPDFNFWLNQPHEIRMRDFRHWLAKLEPLSEAIRELLWLTREGAQPTREIAVGGLFQKSLEREISFQLIRITMPPGSTCFPEISGNQHRFTVRFLGWENVNVRPRHITEDVTFYIACC